ncbi:protein AGENET DOMAIN (AGD)-CONTAINING P1-like [Ziziphus jujuba]|uniref:Protein AGENET DOMAIN (AGD)-CONTAINING P1-like n=1 Tax=Ziziphus jujuba TaxID=326968 RepID=A0A6P6FYJ1_ZIZJJ|nr:protein AGENET DOMAIN (AGD)-CONTAINING P1-like [Ziziphus jujuba]
MFVYSHWLLLPQQASKQTKTEKMRSTRSSVVEEEEEEHLHEGSKVEVFFSKEDGLQNAWLSAVVLKTPPPPPPYCSPSSSSEMKKRKTSSDSKVLVRYDHLHTVARNHHRKPPITQYVKPFFIRPLPPPEDPDQQVIELNEIVDAFHRNVWWTGVVINVVGDKYYVEFKNPPDILELVRSQIRLHRNWVQGTWNSPQKHQKTTRSSLFNPGEAIEVNLENELPCIVWSPAIFLGEVRPYQFLVQSKNSKIEGEGFHKISVKLHQIRPHPPLAEVKFDVFEKVDAFDGLDWWVGVITKVLT